MPNAMLSKRNTSSKYSCLSTNKQEERLHDQQYPFALMENPLTTTDLQMASPHQLAFERQWALPREVQVSIMVSIISIFEPVEYVIS
jgi:hypothetical protein